MFSWHDPLQSIAFWKPQCSSWELMHRLQLSASTKANRKVFPWGFALRTFRALVLAKWNPVMLYTVQWQCSKMPWPFEVPCGLGEIPEDHWLIFLYEIAHLFFVFCFKSLSPKRKEALPAACRIWFNFGRCLYSNPSIIL